MQWGCTCVCDSWGHHAAHRQSF